MWCVLVESIFGSSVWSCFIHVRNYLSGFWIELILQPQTVWDCGPMSQWSWCPVMGLFPDLMLQWLLPPAADGCRLDNRFDAARGYFRRRISWEWCNDGMALPDMSSIDLYSCYLTVCYGNHGPSSSMIDDLPWFTYSQWWFSIAKWRNRCYQLWVRFWDP